MNDLIMRALSYVDDRWITEAMSDQETLKMKRFFQKERQKQYFCTGMCIAAAACILSISLMWSMIQKSRNNHPLQSTLMETQSDSESSIETQSKSESDSEFESKSEFESTTEIHSEAATNQISINRNFTSITYGYAGNTLSLNDSARKDRLCSAIEALSLEDASDEDLANYESLVGSYLIEFNNGIACAFTSQYFYYSNSAHPEMSKLYRLSNSDDFDTIRSLVEELAQ